MPSSERLDDLAHSSPAMAKALLLRGGSVVSPDGVVRADVLCKGEKIAAVGVDLSAEATAAEATIVDVSGQLLVPGASRRARLCPRPRPRPRPLLAHVVPAQ